MPDFNMLSDFLNSTEGNDQVAEIMNLVWLFQLVKYKCSTCLNFFGTLPPAPGGYEGEHHTPSVIWFRAYSSTNDYLVHGHLSNRGKIKRTSKKRGLK